MEKKNNKQQRKEERSMTIMLIIAILVVVFMVVLLILSVLNKIPEEDSVKAVSIVSVPIMIFFASKVRFNN